ncbi:MAG: acyltransferase family protein [Actinomycetales bacterium]|nr:acyltransferase family protein [Actinomycetales bacterium]
MTEPSPRSATAAEGTGRRYAGLDGLRVIAVALVLVYHLAPPLLPAGYIGVDLFFVISGFLITSLLLREGLRTPGALRRFWLRRARRLLPALAAVVVVSAALALLVGGDVLYRIGVQILGAATFSYNWWAIAAGGGYFESTAPELLRNVWSLAVEEQFYLLWPLALLLLVRIPRVGLRAGLTAAGSLASAGLLLGLLATGADLTRVYYGTDSHAFGLLLGAAVALGTERMRNAAAGTGAGRHPALPVVATVLGAAALAGLVVLAALPAPGEGGFARALLLAAALGVIAVTGASWPGSPLGRLLDAPPLRWVGDRSYGLYLWHWPLLVLALAATPGSTPGRVPLATGIAVLLATVLLAALSHRWLETPVRRLGFRGALRQARTALRGGGSRASRTLGAALAGVLLVASAGAAVAIAPTATSAEQYIAAGQAQLDHATRSPADPAAPSGSPSAADTAEPGAPSAPPTADPATPIDSATPAVPGAPGDPVPGTATAEPGSDSTPEPAPGPAPVDGSRVDAVGDSVMLAAAGGLLERLPGIRIDAQVSRSMYVGPDIVAALGGGLRDYLVVALGTNGPVERDTIEEIVAMAGRDRTVVLVTAFADRDWIPGVNATLAEVARRDRNVVLADWAGAIAGHDDELAGDGIHPDSDGGRRFAEVVAAAIDAAEAAKLARIQERGVLETVQEQRLERLPPPSGEPPSGGLWVEPGAGDAPATGRTPAPPR